MTTARRFEIGPAPSALVGDTWPGDGRAVVLLHSGVTDRRSWTGVPEALAGTGVTVVTYDRRGFGESPPGDAVLVEDLRAVLDDQCRGAERIWLVGNSMGGGLALDAALDESLRAEGRLAGLVLLAPGVRHGPDIEIDDATEAIDEQAEAARERGDLDEANRLDAWLWLDGPEQPERRVGGRVRELFLEMNAIALRTEAEVTYDLPGAGVDVWPRLDQVDLPVVVACGDYDVPAMLEQSRLVAEALPHSRFQLLVGRGHIPALEDPDEVAALIVEAIASRAGSGPGSADD